MAGKSPSHRNTTVISLITNPKLHHINATPIYRIHQGGGRGEGKAMGEGDGGDGYLKRYRPIEAEERERGTMKKME